MHSFHVVPACVSHHSLQIREEDGGGGGGEEELLQVGEDLG